jgi:fatty-acid desaturase
MFKSSSNAILTIQIVSMMLTTVGIYFYGLGMLEILTALIFYFLYCGIGVGMMLHRFYSHKSFSFKSNVIQKLFTACAVFAGRGSPLGWVYVHREHHAYSDTTRDPHAPTSKAMLLPHRTLIEEKINLRIIRDLLDKENIFINDWYMLIHIVFVVMLTMANPWLTVFVWAVPVFVTATMMDVSTYFNHTLGYRNFDSRDNSKNNWLFGFTMFGEGWHNNHHHNPKLTSTKIKWWEFDLIGKIINLVD